LIGQKTDSFYIHSGFKQYILGADKSICKGTLLSEDTIKYDGKVEISGAINFNTPYEIEGVPFLFVSLNFDIKLKLQDISLIKIYTKHLYRKYKKLALKDFDKIVSFLNLNWGYLGRPKNKFNSIIGYGYEWSNNDTLMWAILQTNKSNKKNPSYVISVVFKKKIRLRLK
jgi:hypothetical protein